MSTPAQRGEVTETKRYMALRPENTLVREYTEASGIVCLEYRHPARQGVLFQIAIR